MKKLLFLTILLVTMVSNAQINLTGSVKDSIGEPLEMANVLAFNEVTKKMSSYFFTFFRSFNQFFF
jgi:hypothetical protein